VKGKINIIFFSVSLCLCVRYWFLGCGRVLNNKNIFFCFFNSVCPCLSVANYFFVRVGFSVFVPLWLILVNLD